MAEETPAEYQARIDAEWNQFVAVAPIYFDGVLAVQVGAPVPADNVKKYSYEEQGLVKRVHTPNAAAKIAKTEKDA